MTSDVACGREGLIALAQERFSFLRQERGFRVEIEDRAHTSVLAYVGERAAFEVELDWRERCVFLLVAYLVEGRRPPGYYLHEGRRVRVRLAEALARGGERERRAAAALRAVSRGSGPAAMKAQITLFAATLHESLDSLLARFPKIFH